MFKSLEKYKGMLSALGVFVVLIVFYNYFSNPTAPTGETAQSIGTDVLQLNENLQKVTLERAVLNTSLYKSLSDWSPVLVEQAVGRSNPFAEIGK